MRCKQILYNFLSNAIKFTPAEGRITISFLLRDGWARVEVRDSGSGIRAADLDRLFRPFSQLERNGPTALGGTGLGLALTKQLAEPASSDERLLVLIVDDDPRSCELLTLTQGGAGYRTRVASTGESGLELAKQLQPAVILLDVLLPGMDGWQLLRELRGCAETANIPVVMATVSSDRQRAFGLGALAHLTKPIDRHALLETLGRHSFGAQVEARPVHVLVVDDDPRHLELVRASLEPRGYTVTTAASGQEGLAAASRGPCDLLLLDLVLPDLSGVEVVAELRRDPVTRSLPIILRIDDLLYEVQQVARKVSRG